MEPEIVYLELKKIGCCNRCCLRHLGQESSNFEEPEKFLEELLPFTLEDDVRVKRVRTNPCVICMGLLEDSFLNEIIGHPCWEELKKYETDNYRINLNTPPNMSIREKAVQLYVKQKFPEYYEFHKLDEKIPIINLVFKLAFKTKLDQYCGKKYDVHSGVQLWTILHHDENEKEVQIMNSLDYNTYRRRKYLGDKMYGKSAITNTLSTVDEKKFLKFVKVPPEAPSTSVRISSVTIESLPIFIGGRYCKYSRLICQTPWNTECLGLDVVRNDLKPGNREKVVENCVQDIIFDGLHEIFGFPKEKMTFSASGREDTDVRCLGRGRPFYVKIDSVRKTFPEELFRKLETVINKSPDVSVFDMQQTDKTSIKEIKLGEEMKKKTYLVLGLIRDYKNAEQIVQEINKLDCSQISIQQTTPIRVSHRRTLAVRIKKIFYMRAVEVPGHSDLFQLMLTSQAGTYIKEFIHGDFGRTFPSLSDLVKSNLDIFRLDVVDIDLNWPKHINSVPYQVIKKEEIFSAEKPFQNAKMNENQKANPDIVKEESPS